MKFSPQFGANLLFVGLLVACSSAPQREGTPHFGDSVRAREPQPEAYEELIQKNSAGNNDYSGLYNTFEFRATIVSAAVRDAILAKQAADYQWDEAKLRQEREKLDKDMSEGTTVFLSFFTPERKNDNLVEENSIWRILLDVGERRYVGKPKKDRRVPVELMSLYPYHTRWATPYVVKFPVPTAATEGQPMSLTVTGPMGAQTVHWGDIPAQ